MLPITGVSTTDRLVSPFAFLQWQGWLYIEIRKLLQCYCSILIIDFKTIDYYLQLYRKTVIEDTKQNI